MRTGRMTMGGEGGGFSQKSISWKGRARWLFLSSFAVGAWAQVGGDDYDYDYDSDDLRYQSGVIPFFENTTRIRVCSSPWTPAVECEVGSTDSPAEQWRQASGYEIEVFKKIMPMLGWTDEMLDFRCMDWTPMMEALEDGSGACDIAPSGIGPDTETMELGVQYSDPSIFAGYAVMMRPQETSSRNIWYFFSAMSWEVWVALVLSAFVAGLVVWLMELGSQTITSDTRYLSSVVWDTVGRPVQMRDFRMGSIAGNLVAWVWSFTAFIVMSLYNASLTANMTIEQLKALPQRMSDLATLRVGTWSEYTDSLQVYGIDAVPFEWESIEDERRMMDALVGGEIDALVLDEPFLRYLDANNCSTVIVEAIKPVQVQGLHTGFPNYTSEDTIEAYNVALRQLLDEDQLTSLRNEFVYQEGLPCKSSAASENLMLVTWDDVAGLWLMLAVSVGLALVMVGSFRLWNHWLSKTPMFRKTSHLTRAWSGQLQSIADKNLSANMEPSQRGGRGDPEMRDLVLALQTQLEGVEALIKEQKRQGY